MFILRCVIRCNKDVHGKPKQTCTVYHHHKQPGVHTTCIWTPWPHNAQYRCTRRIRSERVGLETGTFRFLIFHLTTELLMSSTLNFTLATTHFMYSFIARYKHPVILKDQIRSQSNIFLSYAMSYMMSYILQESTFLVSNSPLSHRMKCDFYSSTFLFR